MSEQVKVLNPDGIHARPAGLIAKAVQDSGCALTLSLPGAGPVDASSVMMVMTLGAQCGDVVTVECDNADVAAKVKNILQANDDA
ncbi:MAG: HPr family phosphocarrier protein [Actinomycetaceae bacterium]|nr:HPr family phosphocarrier protein [Actinomycetaceae bacterium]